MSIVSRFLTSVMLAGSLLVGGLGSAAMQAPAQAAQASGALYLETTAGVAVKVRARPAKLCVKLASTSQLQFVRVRNETSSTATLYSDAGCKKRVAWCQPRKSINLNAKVILSVRFTRA